MDKQAEGGELRHACTLGNATTALHNRGLPWAPKPLQRWLYVLREEFNLVSSTKDALQGLFHLLRSFVAVEPLCTGSQSIIPAPDSAAELLSVVCAGQNKVPAAPINSQPHKDVLFSVNH